MCSKTRLQEPNNAQRSCVLCYAPYLVCADCPPRISLIVNLYLADDTGRSHSGTDTAKEMGGL